LGRRFTPGHNYWYSKENDHPITGRINSYGWRDKEWSLRKPQDTYRIAVLGDSVVEALQVETDRTFLALTEHRLNETRNQNLEVELMNFGHSGYTQTEELLVLKNEVEQFSPDMVLLFFWPGNDIQDVNRETATDLLRPFYHISESGKLMLDTDFVKRLEFKIKSSVNWIKQHSALISLLGDRYMYIRFNVYEKQKRARANSKLKAKGAKPLPKKIDGYLSLFTATPDTTYLRNYRLNKILIKAMSEYSKEKGIRFMLVTLNTPAYIPEVEKRYKSIDSSFDTNFLEDDLKDFAKSINVEYLGLQRIFRQSYESTGISLHWKHWNYQGHKVVAYALTNKLKSIIYSKKEEE
jgi:hypothetical protein